MVMAESRLRRLHAALAEPRFSRRREEDRTLTRANVPATMLQSLPGEANVTPGNALAIADAYACVRALADAAASLPLHVYRRTDDGRQRLEAAPPSCCAARRRPRRPPALLASSWRT